MHAQDHAKLQRAIKTASGIIDVDQVSAADLKKAGQILSDPAGVPEELQVKGQNSATQDRTIQQIIYVDRSSIDRCQIVLHCASDCTHYI